MNFEKLEAFVEDFYSNYKHVRLNKWNYEDGCILLAAIELYEATGERKYRDFVIGYLDAYVEEDGVIRHYCREEYNLDNICPGRGLLFAFKETGEKKYKKAASTLMSQLASQPRTQEGSFWHKKIYPCQVWLDGLFMAQPFYMAWDIRFGGGGHCDDIIRQFENVRSRMFDEKKKLYYHGYDETHSIFWADRGTGCSANCWLRAECWYLMAIVDTLEEFAGKEKVLKTAGPTEESKEAARGMCGQLLNRETAVKLAALYREGIDGLLRYRDRESRLFFQIPDCPELAGNYVETSGSAMAAASILKACRLGILEDETYWDIGREIMEELAERKLVQTEDGRTVLTDVCHVAGLGPEPGRRDGSAAYYLSEPRGYDDNKGNAALFMAYAQYFMGKGTSTAFR